MAENKDISKLTRQKKELTQEFVDLAQEQFGTRPSEIEKKLCIGNDVWRAYRSGKRSMNPKALKLRLDKALKEHTLPEEDAKKLLGKVSELLIEIDKSKTTHICGESYIYDTRAFQLEEFSTAVKQLAMLANTINEDHQAEEILGALAPLQELISDLTSQKDLPTKPLRSIEEFFEDRLYRDVKEKWGETVPKDVCKIFGKKHGLKITNKNATSLSVAQKMAALRKEALEADKQIKN